MTRLLGRLGLGDSLPVRMGRRFFRPDGFVNVRVGGLVLHVPDAFLAHYVRGEYEPLTADWVRRSSRRGMVAVDVGAHIGYFTLLLARLAGPEGRVYAVEPAADNLAFLERNVTANGLRTVTIVPVAAGAGRGPRALVLTGSSDSHGFYAHPLAPTEGSIEVSEMPLDELVPYPVDLVKIDVEGAEPEVLAGMPRLLDSPGLRLVVEWNPACLRAAGHDPAGLPASLRALGFEVVVADERARRLRRPAEIDPAAVDESWYGNLLCSR